MMRSASFDGEELYQREVFRKPIRTPDGSSCLALDRPADETTTRTTSRAPLCGPVTLSLSHEGQLHPGLYRRPEPIVVFRDHRFRVWVPESPEAGPPEWGRRLLDSRQGGS
jgi:hypothetical protein